MLRAYDKATGQEVGLGLHAGAADRIADDVHAERPAVLVVAISGANYSGELRGVPAAAGGDDDGANAVGERA